MKTIVLDIETSARPEAEIVDLLPAIEPPGNYRDPEKITAYLAEKRARLLTDAALDPVLGRVLVTGILAEGSFEPITDEDEAALLRNTWVRIGDHFLAGCRVVTFCGHRFDFPFLARRSWALGVPVPHWFPRDGRWPRSVFIDLAEVWAAGDRGVTISLDRLARLCGVGRKTGSGSDFGLLWRTDRDAALRYLETDLRLTSVLAERMLAHDTPAEEDRS